MGASEAAVSSEQEVLDTMQLGLANRAVASTSMNAVSSRSHCIVNLYVTRQWSNGNEMQHSKLCLVILHGIRPNCQHVCPSCMAASICRNTS